MNKVFPSAILFTIALLGFFGHSYPAENEKGDRLIAFLCPKWSFVQYLL